MIQEQEDPHEHQNESVSHVGLLKLASLCLVMAVALAALPTAMAESRGGLSEAFSAYAAVLRNYESGIRAYWQGGGNWSNNGDYSPAAEPRAIALADIMGDETPELIFMARQGETGCDADLFIYAWQDGEARMVARHIGLDTFAGDQAVAFLAGEPDVSALSGAGAQADPEPEGMGLPEAVYERVMIAELTPDEYMLMVFHADGSFEQTWSIAAARSDQDVYDSSLGTIDSVRQIGEGVYELHVADTGRGDGGYDGYSSTQAGETLTLVLPGAGPDALHGSIIETYDENYEEIPPVYNSEYFYIGQKNPDGSILYTPYYSQKYVDKYMKD